MHTLTSLPSQGANANLRIVCDTAFALYIQRRSLANFSRHDLQAPSDGRQVTDGYGSKCDDIHLIFDSADLPFGNCQSSSAAANHLRAPPHLLRELDFHPATNHSTPVCQRCTGSQTITSYT